MLPLLWWQRPHGPPCCALTECVGHRNTSGQPSSPPLPLGHIPQASQMPPSPFFRSDHIPPGGRPRPLYLKLHPPYLDSAPFALFSPAFSTPVSSLICFFILSPTCLCGFLCVLFTEPRLGPDAYWVFNICGIDS